MNLEKLKPWNWFKHEEGGNGGSQVPVSRERSTGQSPGKGPGSLMSLHREMDRWFEDAIRSFGMPAFEPKTLTDAALAGFYRPQIDVSGDENSYEISLDVPGLSESDLSIERSYGSFQRTLALPDDANADEIKASLDKGVLKLEIPRRAALEKEDVKRIPISS
jgi:HSP20 family protein